MERLFRELLWRSVWTCQRTGTPKRFRKAARVAVVLQKEKYIFFFIKIPAYFPGVARAFIYPNLIVICVPSLAEIAHLDGIFSIITSTLLGGTLPTRGLIYILLHLRTKYSMAASSLSHHILSLYCTRRLMRNYFWIILFALYWIRAN
jgi:hypothetical protein